MVDSIQGTQLIVMIHFSFTAGFTWCTIAAPARFTNTFFSHRASTQFIACMTCLTSQTFLFWLLQTIAFLPVYLCLSFNTSEYVSLPCFIHLLSFHPSVLPYSHQSSHGPKRINFVILVCKSNPHCHLFVDTHSCLFDQVQAPLTSHLN